MADTAWTQFANAGDMPENMGIAENPAKDGINTSDSCLMYVVKDAADPWAGAWSDAFGPIEITEGNHMLQMMVYKDKVSPTGLKLEQGDGEPAQVEIKVSNTVTGEWELLTFDFTDAIGVNYTRLTIFPDFPADARTSGGTVYIDNIDWVGGTSANPSRLEQISVFPNPAADRLTVVFREMSRITITNLVGQQLEEIPLSNAEQRVVDVSGLKTGVYFLTVESAGRTSTTKFMKR